MRRNRTFNQYDSSFDNFLTNLLSGLVVYSFFPKKHSQNNEIINNNSLIMVD